MVINNIYLTKDYTDNDMDTFFINFKILKYDNFVIFNSEHKVHGIS